MYTENVVSAVPEIAANADDYLREIGCTELSTEKNTVPAVPDNKAKGNAFMPK